ncbi:MAG TPA: PEP-CTERM sorting domain-containing protein [Nitrospiraceae bacterium]|nr:PEP-CTERM sorting domain-containing protein [Nitrospiraceae bacterium]
MMTRSLLVGILALLCLPSATQATIITMTEASIEWPGMEINVPQNWRIEELKSTGSAVVRTDRPEASASGESASLRVNDELGLREGGAWTSSNSFNPAFSSGGGFGHTGITIDSLNLHNGGMRPEMSAEVSMLTTFLVSGEGQAHMTLTVPFNLIIQRSEAMVDSVTIGSNVAFASVCADGFGCQQSTLGWGTRALRNGGDADAVSIRNESTLQIARDFMNPMRTLVSVETHAWSYARIESVPEPSSLILLFASAFLAWVLYPGRIRRRSHRWPGDEFRRP